MNLDDKNIELKVFEKCYVCFEKTTNQSSCHCKIKVCPDCLQQIILNNGKRCSVCKKMIIIVSENNERINHGQYRAYDPDYICSQIIQNIICVTSAFVCCIICL